MSAKATRATKAKEASVVISTRPKYRCRGPRVKEDSIERRGCGATLDELIDKVKADGENHAIECPKCGNLSSVRKIPVVEVEAAAAEG